MHRRPSMFQEKIQDRYVESWRLTSVAGGRRVSLLPANAGYSVKDAGMDCPGNIKMPSLWDGNTMGNVRKYLSFPVGQKQ